MGREGGDGEGGRKGFGDRSYEEIMFMLKTTPCFFAIGTSSAYTRPVCITLIRCYLVKHMGTEHISFQRHSLLILFLPSGTSGCLQ